MCKYVIGTFVRISKYITTWNTYTLLFHQLLHMLFSICLPSQLLGQFAGIIGPWMMVLMRETIQTIPTLVLVDALSQDKANYHLATILPPIQILLLPTWILLLPIWILLLPFQTIYSLRS